MTEKRAFLSGRTLRWGLFASIAVNVVLVGLIAGAVFRDKAQQPQAQLLRGDILRPLYQALPAEDQKQVRQQLAEQSASFRVVRREFVRANRDVMTALTATPFEEAQLARAIEGHRGILLKFGQSGQAVIITHLSSLSEAERAAVAEALRQNMSRRPKPKGHKGERPRPAQD
ncbi:MAG: periplasmic heavy metal sensor [Pseudomonadota bacterium]